MSVTEFYVGLPSCMIMTIKDKNNHTLVVDYGRLPAGDLTYDSMRVSSFRIEDDCVSCTIVVDTI